MISHLHQPDHFGFANLLVIMSFVNNIFGPRVIYFIRYQYGMLLFLFCEFAHHLVLQELGNSHEVHEGDTKDERNEPTHLKYDNHNTKNDYNIEPLTSK